MYNRRGAARRWTSRNRRVNRIPPKFPLPDCYNDSGATNTSHSDVFGDTVSPHLGWWLYFDEAYDESNPGVELVRIFETYFKTRFPISIQELLASENHKFFLVDVEDMLENNDILSGIPDLLEKLVNSPEVVINSMGLAMHQIVCQKPDPTTAEPLCEDEGDDEPTSSGDCVWLTKTKPVAIRARLFNLNPLTPLKDIKTKHLGRLISVRGIVVRVSSVDPVCFRMAFCCSNCGNRQALRLIGGKYDVPTRCSSRECFGRSFVPDCSSDLTETVSQQSIRLQELREDREEAKVPRFIECELSYDLGFDTSVQTCMHSDVITLTGILRANSSTATEGSRDREDDCMFSMYIEANSVIKHAAHSSSLAHAVDVDVEFSKGDLMFVRELFMEPDRFRVLVHSLCPAIYGHEVVKAGLLLALFGGTQRDGASRNDVPVRANPHVLVIGDPGLGKSQILKACSVLSPRGVFVSGRNATVAGLTVSMCNNGRCESLESGAFVLSDGGCCCIDELDKMGSSQQQALLEVMEQQSINLAKSGVLCNLLARCSILATANPNAGHYDRSKTVAENLRGAFGSTSALLSRFDLVFILVDRPDKEVDANLSKHIFSQRFRRCSVESSTPVASTSKWSSANVTPVMEHVSQNLESLREKLKLKAQEPPLDVVPHRLLCKYIAYARKYVHPTLSEEALGVLHAFYLELRKNGRSESGTPVTLRQLEALVRLAQARARIDLREEVNEADADDVIDIMRYSLMETLTDEFGKVHFNRGPQGSGISRQSKAKKFIAALSIESERLKRTMFSVQEMRDFAKERSLQIADFDGFLESLNLQGYLLHKGLRHYQLHNV